MYQALLIVLLLPTGLQEPDSNAQYRQEYAQYEDILDVADPADKATQFMDFGDRGFDERLLGAVATGIQEALQALSGSDALYPLADRWDAQTGEMNGAVLSLQSAAGGGDHANIVKYGEIVYAANPMIQIADFLAVSYKELDNNDKYLEYADILIEERDVAEAFDFAYDIYQQEREVPNWNAAARWATRLKALTSAPEGVTAAEWRNMGIDFQRTIARAEYEAGRYPNAITEYRTLASMNRSQRAISNFYMCRSHFEIGGSDQVNLAMLRCADAAVLNDDTYSDGAMAMVREIYTANTAGTTEGMQENVILPARARMR